MAFITGPKVLEKILDHLGLPTAPPPVAPPRLPIEVDLPLDDEPPDEGDDSVAQVLRTRFPPAPL
ncbi:MAG: hypothetical protein FJ125_15735 [Deltaproteobacteria bacterium]|nr:hypothetical protein [Deltaproteobacteria bacterium]